MQFEGGKNADRDQKHSTCARVTMPSDMRACLDRNSFRNKKLTNAEKNRWIIVEGILRTSTPSPLPTVKASRGLNHDEFQNRLKTFVPFGPGLRFYYLLT